MPATGALIATPRVTGCSDCLCASLIVALRCTPRAGGPISGPPSKAEPTKESPHLALPGQRDEGVRTVTLLPEPRLETSSDPHLVRSLDEADHLMWPLWPFSPLI